MTTRTAPGQREHQITSGHNNRWRTFYASSAVLKSTRDCTMLGPSMRRVGLIDITVGNATRLGATLRPRRCASHHIATQRLSRWGSPAARARLARTVPPNDASVESWQGESGDRATAQAQQSLPVIACALLTPSLTVATGKRPCGASKRQQRQEANGHVHCGLNRAEPLRVAGVEKVPDGDSRHLMAKIRDGTDERCLVVARRVWLQCDTESMRRISYVGVVTIAI